MLRRRCPDASVQGLDADRTGAATAQSGIRAIRARSGPRRMRAALGRSRPRASGIGGEVRGRSLAAGRLSTHRPRHRRESRDRRCPLAVAPVGWTSPRVSSAETSTSSTDGTSARSPSPRAPPRAPARGAQPVGVRCRSPRSPAALKPPGVDPGRSSRGRAFEHAANYLVNPKGEDLRTGPVARDPTTLVVSSSVPALSCARGRDPAHVRSSQDRPKTPHA